jgi:hypothetical protein
MDQGMAALLAGVGALAGSSLGALAAWRGARIGAQKAVEAVQVQVEGQYQAEHRHWAREERKNSWMAALKAARLAVTALHDMERDLRQGRIPAAGSRSAITDAAPDIATGVVELSVWGPDEGAEACAELHAKIVEQTEAVLAWETAVSQGREATQEQEAYVAADERRIDAYSRFLYSARQCLRDSTTS